MTRTWDTWNRLAYLLSLLPAESPPCPAKHFCDWCCSQFRLHDKQTTRAVGHVLPGVAVGTAVTLHLHGPRRGDVQSSSLGGREATRCVWPQCPGNSLSPSLRQQGELWWCPLAALWGNGVGQWCFRDGIPPPAWNQVLPHCLVAYKEWGSLLHLV